MLSTITAFIRHLSIFSKVQASGTGRGSYLAIAPDPRKFTQSWYTIKFGDGSDKRLPSYSTTNGTYWGGHNHAEDESGVQLGKYLERRVLQALPGVEGTRQPSDFPGIERGPKYKPTIRSEWYIIRRTGEDNGDRLGSCYNEKFARTLVEMIKKYPTHRLETEEGREEAVDDLKRTLREFL